jgi:magnesium chelatase subunit I
LRVAVRGLRRRSERLEAYRRSVAYRMNARQVIHAYGDSTEQARLEITAAREALAGSRLSSAAERYGLRVIERLEIDSLRAEITLFEAARAHAVADGRGVAVPADVQAVAPMALRLRRTITLRGDTVRGPRSEEGELRRAVQTRPPSGKRPAKK